MRRKIASRVIPASARKSGLPKRPTSSHIVSGGVPRLHPGNNLGHDAVNNRPKVMAKSHPGNNLGHDAVNNRPKVQGKPKLHPGNNLGHDAVDNRPHVTGDPVTKKKAKQVGKGPGPKQRSNVNYVIKNQKKHGKTLTRAEARAKVKKNIRADKHGSAYRHDFAGDGSFKKDKDYGTKRNNAIRKKRGFKPVTHPKTHKKGNGDGSGKGTDTGNKNDAGNSDSNGYGGPQSQGTTNRNKNAAKTKADTKARNGIAAKRRRRHRPIGGGR